MADGKPRVRTIVLRDRGWSRRHDLRREARKAEAYIEAEEGALNRLSGIAGIAVTTIAVTMSLFHLYAACRPTTHR